LSNSSNFEAAKKNLFYVTSRSATVKHRCVTRLYMRASLSFFTAGFVTTVCNLASNIFIHVVYIAFKRKPNKEQKSTRVRRNKSQSSNIKPGSKNIFSINIIVIKAATHTCN